MPQCLRALRNSNEVLFEIHYKNTTHQARLHREALQSRLRPIYEKILQRLPQDRTVLVGDRVNALPGLTQLLPETAVLSAEAVFKGCTEHQAHIRSRGPALSFITALPVTSKPSISAVQRTVEPARRNGAAVQRPVRVTHVLSGHQAWPLSPAGTYLSASGVVSASRAPDSCCEVTTDADGQAVVTCGDEHDVYLNGAQIRDRVVVQPGDRLGLPQSGSSYIFICVN